MKTDSAPRSHDRTESEIEYLDTIIDVSKKIHMWPLENPTKREKIKFDIYIWVTFVYCCLMVCSLVTYVTIHYGNIDGVVDTIDHATVFVSGTFRYMYIYFRGATYIQLVEKLRKNFIRSPLFGTYDVDVLYSDYKKAKRLIMFYNTPIFFWIAQAMILPIVKFTGHVVADSINNSLNITKIPFQPPLYGYFPMDVTHMPGGIAFYLFESYAIVIFAIIYAFVDNFWVMTLMLSLSQFDILKTSVESIGKNIERNKEEGELYLSPLEMKEFDSKLKKCIRHHQFLRQFIRLSDNLLNPNVLVDYFHAIISIAFLMLEVTVTLKLGAWARFAHSFQYLMVSIIHMFIFDWVGQELADKEKALCDAFFGLPWYKYPAKKTEITLAILLCSHPLGISGGRTFRLNLEFFTRTIRMIFSYFTFLLQMRSKGENEIAF
ncbi:hypothetical protein RUM44_010769 [Polyplax serrata]|uniref:Odorant receptor n=1 Tax=Polyplax serrata TaxID=468196 RepID=A0ABR1AN47_POLSC